MLFGIYKRILGFISRPKQITPQDVNLIHELKSKYIHSYREFYHGKNRYITDCLYCHAVPGTIEIALLQLVDLFQNKLKNKLLNLGGGNGQVTNILKEIGLDVINLDIDIEEDLKNIKHDLNDACDLPFESETFDFVFCQEVIEHIENPWKLLRNIKRILKKDGFFLLTTPNIQSIHSKKIFNKNGYFHWFTPDCFGYHINPLPIWEIRLIAEKNNLKIRDIRGNGEYYFKPVNPHNNHDIVNNNECLIFIMETKY